MAEPAAAGCPTCGAAVNGRFCAACGEQRVTERDYSVAHYIGHVFESLTSFDIRSLRALWTLMARPGRLTRDYLDGRRRIYLGPVQLFVLVNVVFALAGANTFRTPLAVQEHDPPFPAFKRSPGSSPSLGMMVLIYPIVLTYRFLLFFVTLWTMH